jgi:NhaP-type Na+/H+ or K+/H+ antiporter
LGVQCLAVGVQLPRHYISKHYSSLLILLGPVMAYGWLVCAFFLHLFLHVGYPTGLVIAACLTPTDPVLAASVLSNSQFSDRVPARIRHLLTAESGCNDGVSFPFLYLGLSMLLRATYGATLKKWFLITILWQCVFGTLVGTVIGHAFNRLLRWSDARSMVGRPSYLVFYLLLAMFSIGVASTLGIDDFLVAFSAGAAFSWDGWFASKTASSNFASIVDLVLNSAMFVYFGSIIPWDDFHLSWPDSPTQVLITPWRLVALLVLILLFRRIPAVLALKPFTRDIRTWPEAIFCGHFGPMGVGALFLAIEARAQLETDTSEPLPHPPPPGELSGRNQRAVAMIWPIICFIVLGSTMVHGLSTLAVSVSLHVKRPEGERAPLIGAETEGLEGMVHSESEGDDM